MNMRHAQILLALLLTLTLPTRAQSLEESFVTVTPGASAPDWFIPNPNWKSEVTAGDFPDGAHAVTFSPADPAQPGMGNLMRQFDATPYRGRHIQLTAKVLVVADPNHPGANHRAQMWLRVDCPGGRTGAFDNMGRRPITPAVLPVWQDAVIEADIDADAETIDIGFMAFGGAVSIDAISLKVTGDAAALQPRSPPAQLTIQGWENLKAATRLLSYIRFFHPTDQAVAITDWDAFAVALIEKAEPATDAADLAARLTEVFAPIAPTLVIFTGDPPEPPAAPDTAIGLAHWRHNGAGTINPSNQYNIYSSQVIREPLDKAALAAAHRASFLSPELCEGVRCLFSVKIPYDGAGTLPHIEPAPVAPPVKLTALNRATRIAGVALAWGIFQHFYPYFDVVDTSWEAVLGSALGRAATAEDETAYLLALREMVERLCDGHGNVYNPSLPPPTMLPLALEWAGPDLVVVGVDESAATVQVGDSIISIDGRPAEQCFTRSSRWVSAATDGWRRCASIRFILADMPTADPAIIAFRRPDATGYTARLARTNRYTPGGIPKPAAGATVAPGIVYFDLSGATSDDLKKVIRKLSTAAGIVFDLRGYPEAAAYQVIRHLIDEPATSARWNIPIVTLPDRQGWEWNSAGRWDMQPLAPRFTAPVAFITDGRAISYAESIMGIVEAYKLGEIVGSTTAGTNGNVNPFTLPGGYHISWTGMQVLKHDGSQHHGVGIAPTVPIVPTAKGIAEGRDEPLERAIEVLQKRIQADDK
jgi:hypothetical protein